MLDHVSHSQISMWLRCPRQWEYRYVEGLKVPPSGPLIVGSAYHTALEVNFIQKVNSMKDLPLDDCLDIYSDAWEDRLLEEELIIWERLGPGVSKDQGAGLVQEYIVSTSPSVQPVQVEKTYNREIAGTKFVCRVDVENVQRAVIDHKTSAKAYNQNDVDGDIQASAIAFALDRPIIFYNHIALKQKTPKIQVVKSYRTRADIDWWFDMSTKVVLQMEIGIAPPRSVDAFGKTAYWCNERFCGFYERCRGELTRSYA